MKIAIALLDGMMDASLAVTLDTLRTGARLAGDGPRHEVVLLGEAPSIVTANGFSAATHGRFDALAESDWIVVPGLGQASETELDARLAQPDAAALMAALRGAAERGVPVAASCSSVFLLAEAGLLASRRATTTWWLAEAFRRRYPAVTLDETQMVVCDGPCWSAGAALSQLDLTLALVAELYGQAIAAACAKYLVIDTRPSQARYMIGNHLARRDPLAERADRWIRANLAREIGIAELADALATSPKTLSRHLQQATGCSPIRLIQRLRVEQAIHLLETSDASLEAIAAAVGYRNPVTLRQLIRRELGVTPSTLRRPKRG